MSDLKGLRVAVIATDGVEEVELTDPVRALKDAGAQVSILSPKPGRIQAFKHHDKTRQIDVDESLQNVDPTSFDALLLPGGALNADQVRVDPKVKAFIRAIDGVGKPLAVICHAPWELISANVVRGRTLTSYYTIQDDVRNAGGNWVDREVVVDGNWVTSRQPDDIPAFNREMLSLFAHARTGVSEIAR